MILEYTPTRMVAVKSMYKSETTCLLRFFSVHEYVHNLGDYDTIFMDSFMIKKRLERFPNRKTYSYLSRS
jgi:hypothetical protein